MFNINNINNFFSLKVSVKDFNEIVLDQKLMAQLRALTIGPGSGLNYEMNFIEYNAETRKVKAQAILAHYFGELVGWALLSEESSDFYFSNVLGFEPKDGMLFEVYVHPEHRRKGIGAKLINTAKRLAGEKKLCVCPWDDNSEGFFNNFNHFEYKKL